MISLFRASLILVVVPIFLFAQSTEGEKMSAFGLYASSVSGVGLSFRTTVAKPTSFQFTGGIISVKGDTKWSLGGDILYRIARMPELDITLGPGFGIGGGSSKASGASYGFGIGMDYRSPGDVTSNYMLATVRLYYPAVYSGSGDVTVGGGVGLMVAF